MNLIFISSVEVGSSHVLFWDEKFFPSLMRMVSGFSLKSSSPDSSIHWICGHLICVLDHTNTVVVSGYRFMIILQLYGIFSLPC